MPPERAPATGAKAPNIGLYETLVTARIQQLIGQLPQHTIAEITQLANAESPDRVSRHIAQLVARAIEGLPEQGRAQRAIHIAIELLSELEHHADPRLDLEAERPLDSGRVLQSILRLRP